MWWWGATGGAIALAVVAGIGDWRRGNRKDLDRVGLIDWPAVQMFALIVAAICAALAWQNG